MPASFRSPSAPAAQQRRRSITASNEISEPRRRSFQLPQLALPAACRSSSKGALKGKAQNARGRSSLISNASTMDKSRSSSSSTLSSEDTAESLPCMPRDIPVSRVRRQSLPALSNNLPLVKDLEPKRRSLPNSPQSTVLQRKLSLQGDACGAEVGRPAMQLRNVALIRWIFEEARSRHIGRSSYQARQEDASANRKSGGLSCVIFREVCSDVLAATRKCCKAYRACQHLWAAIPEPMHCKMDLELKTSMQAKAFTVGVLSKMLQDVREKGGDAELMWRQCFDGLASKSVNGKAFGGRSLALRSCRSQTSMSGCASLGSDMFAVA